jgi:ABC-type transporter Mla maintaining outer membrane lipid asymmetry ATPase subunit MlaF
MGAGMPGEQADLMGADYKLHTGAGTAQTGATVIITQNVEVSVSTGQTALVLGPASGAGAASIMTDYWVTNQSATATNALIFVPSGHKLNGSSNASLTLAQFKSAILWQYKYQNWTYVLSA